VADNKLTKSAGEHSTCAALSRLGWAVALTRDGLERTDILAVDTESRQTIEIQVKTANSNSRPTWVLGLKGTAEARTDHEWYVFVLLPQEVEQGSVTSSIDTGVTDMTGMS